MKYRPFRRPLLTFTVLAVLFCAAREARSQGSLTPPGAPAPTMKTLDQIEARTPIPGGTTTTAYFITTPGSYYLTGNITVTSGSGIEIRASGVTIDLNGFALIGGANASYGVYISGVYDAIAIFNGQILAAGTAPGFTGGKFQTGIYYSPTTGDTPSIRVKDITIYGCGVGILLDQNAAGQGPSSLVTGCAVSYASDKSILAGVVTNCSVTNGGGDGITANTVTACNVAVNGATAYGINGIAVAECTVFLVGSSNAGINAYTVTGCKVTCEGGPGAAIFAETVVTDCRAYNFGTGDGIIASNVNSSRATAANNGILATGSVNNCSAFGSKYGISAREATGSDGTTDSSSGNAGLYVTSCATGCTGTAQGSDIGLQSMGTAMNCVGNAKSGTGLYADKAATNCNGNSVSGTGLVTSVAQSCYGVTSTGPTGLTFTKVGALCWGEKDSTNATNYVLGGGLRGTINLP